jgi:hypothetical protein
MVIADAMAAADAASEGGDYLNGYSMTARVLSPDGQSETLSLEQVAPGRYQASYEPGSAGAYWITVSGVPGDSDSPAFTDASSPTPQGVAETTGWVLSYSQEYRLNPSDPTLLPQIASLTGGGIAPADPEAVFRHDLTAPRASQPAWPWLLSLAVLLLPIDIGVRRLVISGAEIRQAVVKLSGLAGARGRAEPSPLHRSQRMDALLQAKRRASLDSQAPTDSLGSEQSSPARPEPQGHATAPTDSGLSTEIGGEKTESHQASTAARLLANKRERRKKQT